MLAGKPPPVPPRPSKAAVEAALARTRLAPVPLARTLLPPGKEQHANSNSWARKEEAGFTDKLQPHREITLSAKQENSLHNGVYSHMEQRMAIETSFGREIRQQKIRYGPLLPTGQHRHVREVLPPQVPLSVPGDCKDISQSSTDETRISASDKSPPLIPTKPPAMVLLGKDSPSPLAPRHEESNMSPLLKRRIDGIVLSKPSSPGVIRRASTKVLKDIPPPPPTRHSPPVVPRQMDSSVVSKENSPPVAVRTANVIELNKDVEPAFVTKHVETVSLDKPKTPSLPAKNVVEHSREERIPPPVPSKPKTPTPSIKRFGSLTSKRENEIRQLSPIIRQETSPPSIERKKTSPEGERIQTVVGGVNNNIDVEESLSLVAAVNEAVVSREERERLPQGTEELTQTSEIVPPVHSPGLDKNAKISELLGPSPELIHNEQPLQGLVSSPSSVPSPEFDKGSPFVESTHSARLDKVLPVLESPVHSPGPRKSSSFSESSVRSPEVDKASPFVQSPQSPGLSKLSPSFESRTHSPGTNTTSSFSESSFRSPEFDKASPFVESPHSPGLSKISPSFESPLHSPGPNKTSSFSESSFRSPESDKMSYFVQSPVSKEVDRVSPALESPVHSPGPDRTFSESSARPPCPDKPSQIIEPPTRFGGLDRSSPLIEDLVVELRESSRQRNAQIHHSDWYKEDADGQQVRFSSCHITLQDLSQADPQQAITHLNCSHEKQHRRVMASLQGLPPLPKSLSGFNLMELTGTSSSTPTNPTSATSFSRPSRPGPSHHAREAPLVALRVRKTTGLDAQLAILRKEMFGLRQLDLSLLSQLWSLNESIQEFRQLLQEQEDSAALSPPSPSSADEGEEFYSPLPRYHAPPGLQLSAVPEQYRLSSSSSQSSIEYGNV